jgi:hypothetical protein
MMAVLLRPATEVQHLLHQWSHRHHHHDLVDLGAQEPLSSQRELVGSQLDADPNRHRPLTLTRSPFFRFSLRRIISSTVKLSLYRACFACKMAQCSLLLSEPGLVCVRFKPRTFAMPASMCWTTWALSCATFALSRASRLSSFRLSFCAAPQSGLPVKEMRPLTGSLCLPRGECVMVLCGRGQRAD